MHIELEGKTIEIIRTELIREIDICTHASQRQISPQMLLHYQQRGKELQRALDNINAEIGER